METAEDRKNAAWAAFKRKYGACGGRNEGNAALQRRIGGHEMPETPDGEGKGGRVAEKVRMEGWKGGRVAEKVGVEGWKGGGEGEGGRVARRHREVEHGLQVACVKWFDLQYPKERMLLFAVPNGGRRDRVTGAKLKAEGVRAGVADLFYAKPKCDVSGFVVCCGLFVEMKTMNDGSCQSEAQRLFEREVKRMGYGYRVCRSVDEFIAVIKDYNKRA